MKKMRLCSMLLAVAMIVGVAGCSKTNDPESSTSPGSSSSASPTSSGNKGSNIQTLADELGYGYVATYETFPIEMEYVNRMIYTGERIVVFGETYDDVTYEYSTILVSMLPDGTDVKTIDLDFGGGNIQNMTSDKEGNLWIYTYEYVYTDSSGNIIDDLPGIMPLEDAELYEETVPEGEGGSEDALDDTLEEPTPEPEVVSNRMLMAVAVAEEPKADYGYYDGDSYESYELYTLYKLGPEGNILIEYSLNDLKTGDNFWVNNLCVDDDGYVYIVYYGDNGNALAVLDSDLKKVFEHSEENSYIENMFTYEGVTYIATWNYNSTTGNGGYEYTPFDKETNKFGTPISASNSNYVYNTIAASDGTLYASSDLTLSRYNPLTGEQVAILNWIDCDLNSNYMRATAIISEDEILAYYRDYTLDTHELIRLKKVPVSEIPDSIYLTYACTYIDYYIKNAIINFNRTNGTYRITIKDYSQYQTDDDWQAGYTKLNNDIISGDIPDIIFTNGLKVSNYISKGLIADLYPFIDGDAEIGRDFFTEGFLNALDSSDGKLYTMGLSFGLETLVGLSSVVGDEPGWTIEEMMEAYRQMPEGTQLVRDTTKEWFLQNFINYCINDFVDYETGQCSFNSDAFIRLLEMANTFPETYDYNYDEDYKYYEDGYLMRTGELMLSSMYYWGFDNDYYRAQFMDMDITAIGYPRSSGVGHSMYVNSQIALSAKSENSEGAWEFIKYLVSYEYQSKTVYEFSANRQLFEEKAKEAMEPRYWIDENGEKVEYDNTYWINEVEVKVPPMTQEEVDEIVEMIKAVESVYSYSYDETMMGIITDEAKAFFGGSKTASEVANLIQGRVSTYILESM